MSIKITLLIILFLFLRLLLFLLWSKLITILMWISTRLFITWRSVSFSFISLTTRMARTSLFSSAHTRSIIHPRWTSRHKLSTILLVRSKRWWLLMLSITISSSLIWHFIGTSSMFLNVFRIHSTLTSNSLATLRFYLLLILFWCWKSSWTTSSTSSGWSWSSRTIRAII